VPGTEGVLDEVESEGLGGERLSGECGVVRFVPPLRREPERREVVVEEEPHRVGLGRRGDRPARYAERSSSVRGIRK
jgi:hypothetical protein